jgi:DNA-binding IscR family transcriptional regulator
MIAQKTRYALRSLLFLAEEQGGAPVQLARTPEQISFGEIVRTMEGPIALVSCASVNFYAPCGDCQDEATCAIRRAFAILRDQSTQVLDSISLAEGANWEERLGGDT